MHRVASPLLLLAGLSLLLLPVGLAAEEGFPHRDEGDRVRFFAHWPANLGQAQAAPIVLDEVFPEDEPDLSEGPGLPGSSTAGTLPTFTYQLHDFFGRPGPLGTLHLDPATPALVTFHLSADQTPWPTVVGEPPEDVDYGIAPEVTVQATVLLGNETVGQGSQTMTLISPPEAVADPVYTYEVEVPLAAAEVPAGSDLRVMLTVHQVDQAGEQVMQPLFNVHTGEAYPTGVALPLTNPEALFLADGHKDESLAHSPVDDMTAEERETLRGTAKMALAGSVVLALVSGVQLVRQVRRN